MHKVTLSFEKKGHNFYFIYKNNRLIKLTVSVVFPNSLRD